MITRFKLYALSLFFAATGMVQAQYVPKKRRFEKDWVSKIEIPAKEQLVLKKNTVYCDTLIMHDYAVLKIDSVKEFSMFANYVQIGKKCVIDAQGKAGKKLALVSDYPKTIGEPGKHLSLKFNIYKLGDLNINTRGGKAGKAFFKDVTRQVELIGIGGSGGNVSLHYYAPFTIMRRKRARKKPNIWFNTAIGKMEDNIRQYNMAPMDVRRQFATNAGQRIGRFESERNMEVNKRRKGLIRVTKSLTPLKE
ncbi:MAG TPA: hypothetical protein DCS93_11940 [Microscillaceae bacterium]|nr:hypothetical protein [Microscillaceae bacterium]